MAIAIAIAIAMTAPIVILSVQRPYGPPTPSRYMACFNAIRKAHLRHARATKMAPGLKAIGPRVE
jgi:hypothetical protein